jgi:hypothetical protein
MVATGRQGESDTGAPAALEEEAQAEPSQGDAAEAGSSLEDLLNRVDHAAPIDPAPHADRSSLPARERAALPEGALDRATLPGSAVAPGLRTARVARMTEAGADIALRGSGQLVIAVIDEGVDRALIERAMASGDRVLVEVTPGEAPIIVGVVQTRVPERLELKAKEIVVDAESEVLIRAGRSAVRLREDGEVELVGSRILTLSRGLFRIVGRVLRLN